jgi:hypothetical protein
LAIVDALHSILSHATREDPIALGDDYFLRPYAVVEMTRIGKKENALPCPFEPSILQFTSYKVREPHRIAVSMLQKMGILDVTLQEYCDQTVAKRKWRGRAVPKKKLFTYTWGGNETDDGYVKALEAMAGCPAPADWETERMKARDEILQGFTGGLKKLSQLMAERK